MFVSYILYLFTVSTSPSHLSQELTSHCLQSLLGPGSEPVDGGVVDQPGEVPAACLEDLANGGHAQYNVQVARTLLDEVGPDTLSGGGAPCLHCLVTNLRER